MDLRQIADSGQSFRMAKLQDRRFSVISGEHYLEIVQGPGEDHAAERSFTFCCDEEELHFWEHYFDLEHDYGVYINSVRKRDSYLSQAARAGSGIRILNQDPWEMIITFVISQQKTIPKIREGYRAKYIFRLCQDAVEGRLDLELLQRLSYGEAMTYLGSFYGIGTKVANCICLFGLHHIEAFPVDTWIEQILMAEYYRKRKKKYDSLPKSKLYQEMIADHFGMYKGYAGVMQQYIFYYELLGK